MDVGLLLQAILVGDAERAGRWLGLVGVEDKQLLDTCDLLEYARVGSAGSVWEGYGPGFVELGLELFFELV